MPLQWDVFSLEVSKVTAIAPSPTNLDKITMVLVNLP